MTKKISNWHISFLIVLVSVLSLALVQRYVLAQWQDPIGLPGESGGFRIVVNPLAEDLQLGGHSLLDTDFILDPGGTIGINIKGVDRGVQTEGGTYGLLGRATQSSGSGVYGVNEFAGGSGIGVKGRSTGIWSTGVRGDGYYGVWAQGYYGLKAESSEAGGIGVWSKQGPGNFSGSFEGAFKVSRSGYPATERLFKLTDNQNDLMLRIDTGNKLHTAQLEFSRGTTVSTDNSWVGPTVSNTFDVWTNENIPMLFGVAGTEKMRLTSGGNLNTSGYMQPGSFDILPACGVSNRGAMAWQTNCGAGVGCLRVCASSGWRTVATD